MPTLRDFIEKINMKAEVIYDEPMALHTSLGIGGPADALVRPRDGVSARSAATAARDADIPLFVLGGGANILVGDKGIRGIVLDTGSLDCVGMEEDGFLFAGAGLSMERLCLEALARGLGGLENFAGMPGSVGGSAFMNARCYEREVADSFAWAEVLTREGSIRRHPFVPGEWAYKSSPFQVGGAAQGAVILAVAFKLEEGDPSRLAAVMRSRRADREAKGHYRLPSAGSIFKNNRGFGAPTGKLLDGLGFRGRRIGGAAVSAWHANIFVNAGGATAADMRSLIDLAREEASRRLGLELEPEVLLVGEF
jgi:UDP-N-acetylmuramate dehydrogenase